MTPVVNKVAAGPPTVISLQGPPGQASLHGICLEGRQLDGSIHMVQLHLEETPLVGAVTI